MQKFSEGIADSRREAAFRSVAMWRIKIFPDRLEAIRFSATPFTRNVMTLRHIWLVSDSLIQASADWAQAWNVWLSRAHLSTRRLKAGGLTWTNDGTLTKFPESTSFSKVKNNWSEPPFSQNTDRGKLLQSNRIQTVLFVLTLVKILWAWLWIFPATPWQLTEITWRGEFVRYSQGHLQHTGKVPPKISISFLPRHSLVSDGECLSSTAFCLPRLRRTETVPLFNRFPPWNNEWSGHGFERCPASFGAVVLVLLLAGVSCLSPKLTDLLGLKTFNKTVWNYSTS